MIQTLEHIGDIGRFMGKEAECFVVYDPNVAWVAEEVMAALPVKGARSLETSEERKTMDSVLAVERWLLEADASRGALLLAVGGGITTDLVGFAASLYKRGIRYANLPTTLLSQVDAAIGGKTGVNLDHYKNMLGAFHMPEYTFLCADVLRTLPPANSAAAWLNSSKPSSWPMPKPTTAPCKALRRRSSPGRPPSRPKSWNGIPTNTANAPS